MPRLHLFEIMDQPWCPAFLRDAMTDYLQHVLNIANPYRPVAGQLVKPSERLSVVANPRLFRSDPVVSP